MTKRDKLIARFLTFPSDFNYTEAVKLVGYFGFVEKNKGKTSGSRVQFRHEDGTKLNLHKPHPDGRLKEYQLKQLKKELGI